MVGMLLRDAGFARIDDGDHNTDMGSFAAKHCVYHRLFQLNMTRVTVLYPLMHMMR